jgi:hypothetical protein
VTRQQLLLLYLSTSDLGSPVVAWSFYDGTGKTSSMSGDTDKPPFASALAAMQAGWRVVQLSGLSPRPPGTEHQTSFLRFEVVLERLVEG